MEVSYFHNGKAIKYDQNQAKFLFETTYPADWGADPASGAEKVGPFHEVVVPALVKIFSQPYELHCNDLKYGGASYQVKFPYNRITTPSISPVPRPTATWTGRPGWPGSSM
jgi:hypothetical protein